MNQHAIDINHEITRRADEAALAEHGDEQKETAMEDTPKYGDKLAALANDVGLPQVAEALAIARVEALMALLTNALHYRATKSYGTLVYDSDEKLAMAERNLEAALDLLHIRRTENKP